MRAFQIECLEFSSRGLEPETGQVYLRWRLLGNGRALELEERFGFGEIADDELDHPSIQAALDLLHWTAGVSYWKAACRGRVEFTSRHPDAFQAEALTRVYREGLAELAWQNGLDRQYWPAFEAGDVPASARSPDAATAGAPDYGLARRALVPMGGGKDSLVALERVRLRGINCDTVQVGSAPLITRVAERAGTNHRVITRRLAPELAQLNDAGALNGHVPITAINAAVLVLAALLWDFGSVVFANERSADTPTLTSPGGQSVNHQFAKSLAFEQLLDDWVRHYVASDLEVFSLLRRDRELGVCREFARLGGYHDVFSSCNRNFHLDGPRTVRWCGECPKCRFVFLGLAPFMEVGALSSIFGRDLLAERGQVEGFAALLELDVPRPFECVGEAGEARAALAALATDRRWCGHAVVERLAARLKGAAVPTLDAMLEPGGPHAIPGRFLP